MAGLVNIQTSRNKDKATHRQGANCTNQVFCFSRGQPAGESAICSPTPFLACSCRMKMLQLNAQQDQGNRAGGMLMDVLLEGRPPSRQSPGLQLQAVNDNPLPSTHELLLPPRGLLLMLSHSLRPSGTRSYQYRTLLSAVQHFMLQHSHDIAHRAATNVLPGGQSPALTLTLGWPVQRLRLCCMNIVLVLQIQRQASLCFSLSLQQAWLPRSVQWIARIDLLVHSADDRRNGLA